MDRKEREANKKWMVRPIGKLTGVVHSSYGDVLINLDTGLILSVRPDAEGDNYNWLSEIIKFDLDEWKTFYDKAAELPDEFDILDLGYYTTDGTYVEPDAKFRRHVW